MTSLTITLLASLLAWQQAPPAPQEAAPPTVTFESLLGEMADPMVLARWPEPAFRQMQASSYNRASTAPGEPGWFADSDGEGFLRTEDHNGRREWVAMEHVGPGCLTRLWAPAFYRSLDVHDVPIVRIYLDGADAPVIEERWIPLLTNIEAGPRSVVVPSPFARRTTRAGDLYLPIPFARSCKVTFDRPPFYNIVNWRAYEPGTTVETFTAAALERQANAIERTGRALTRTPTADDRPHGDGWRIAPGAVSMMSFDGEGLCLSQFALRIDPDEIRRRPSLLRQTILRVDCDGETCVWCPLGDFFGSPDAVHPFATVARAVMADGTFLCRWPMPFRRSLSIGIVNLSNDELSVLLEPETGPFVWDDRAMCFHAGWRPDRILPGDRFEDLRFVDVRGQGVLVGDQLTVLNPTDGWWGEGDEKIYVDGSVDRRFPDHFGTGTEDYYGWAGGVNPTWADVFSHPFLANIAVGSHGGEPAAGGTTRGFNVCARQRGLDAVPFRDRLVFDMEASPGVEQRRPTDRLGYSMVVFWYARPGADADLGAEAGAAMRPLMSLESLSVPR